MVELLPSVLLKWASGPQIAVTKTATHMPLSQAKPKPREHAAATIAAARGRFGKARAKWSTSLSTSVPKPDPRAGESRSHRGATGFDSAKVRALELRVADPELVRDRASASRPRSRAGGATRRGSDSGAGPSLRRGTREPVSRLRPLGSRTSTWRRQTVVRHAIAAGGGRRPGCVARVFLTGWWCVRFSSGPVRSTREGSGSPAASARRSARSEQTETHTG
jgi:hypothetical protein